MIFLSPTLWLCCDDEQDHDYDCYDDDDGRDDCEKRMMNGSKVKECNVCLFLWGSAESAGR